jgi:hypothetical protein
MADYLSKERSQHLKKVYEGVTRVPCKPQTWRNTLCRVRKLVDADPNSKEFELGLWTYATNVAIRRQLHPSQHTKLSLIKDKVDKLFAKYQHLQTPLTFIKAIEKELKIELPRSTRCRYIKFAQRKPFEEKEQLVIIYKVQLRAIGATPKFGECGPETINTTAVDI